MNSVHKIKIIELFLISFQKLTRKFVIGNGLNYGGFDNVPLPADRHVHASLGIISRVGNATMKRYAFSTSHGQHGDHAVPLIIANQSNSNGKNRKLFEKSIEIHLENSLEQTTVMH